jgi:uncharacterized membrane protein (UPF0127 family)
VLQVANDLRPWRMAVARKAKAVLELPAGEAARNSIKTGDQLVLG